MKYQKWFKTLNRSRFQAMHCWCAHKTATLTSIQHTVPGRNWVYMKCCSGKMDYKPLWTSLAKQILTGLIILGNKIKTGWSFYYFNDLTYKMWALGRLRGLRQIVPLKANDILNHNKGGLDKKPFGTLPNFFCWIAWSKHITS